MGSKKNGGQMPPAHWRFLPDETKKQESLLTIQQAVQQKRLQMRPAFWQNVWNQLRFQSWRQWAAQGSVLLFAMCLVYQFGGMPVSDADSAAACSVFLVFAGNICLSSVAHLFSWHMAELEMTLYLDLKQMVCIRMLEAGMIDLFALALLTGSLGSRSQTGMFAYFLYLLVPFLWSDIFYLHMLTHVRGIFSGLRHLSFGVLYGMLALLPGFRRNAYLPQYVPVWAVLSMAGFFVIAAEVYYMLGKIDAGENIFQTGACN